MRAWLLFLVALTAATAGVGIFVGFHWPSDWETEAQATLAAALIAAFSTVFGATAKLAFDVSALAANHRNNVRSNMLERFYLYAGQYLLPFAAAAAETARYLQEYSRAETPARQNAKLDGAFYSAAQYIRLHATFQNTFSLPNAEPPLGIMLSSHKAEKRLWNLVVPPWRFGVSSLIKESVLLEGLTDWDGEMRRPTEFIRLSHVPNSPLADAREAFVTAVTPERILFDLKDVLITLNQLIDYEVGVVFAPWYEDKPDFPMKGLCRLQQFSRAHKQELGIFFLD